MELAPLFTEQRWNIIRHISREELSPIQLAALTGTTMANISQQLRLLEAAGLVSKRKIHNKARGKPRTLFSMQQSYAYVVLMTGSIAEKKLVSLTGEQETMLKAMIAGTEKRAKK